jgi:hypothetical protein
MDHSLIGLVTSTREQVRVACDPFRATRGWTDLAKWMSGRASVRMNAICHGSLSSKTRFARSRMARMRHHFQPRRQDLGTALESSVKHHYAMNELHEWQ